MLPRCCRVCLHTDCVFLRRHRTRRLDRGAQCFPGAEGCACTPTASSCAAIASAAWTEERNASQVLQGVYAHRLRLPRTRRLDRGAQCFPGAAGCVCAPTVSLATAATAMMRWSHLQCMLMNSMEQTTHSTSQHTIPACAGVPWVAEGIICYNCGS